MDEPLDVVIVAGDSPQEVLGKEERDRIRLSVDGVSASLNFLNLYFQAHRNSREALRRLQDEAPPFVSLNGPYLCQFLESRGFRAELVPLYSADPERLASALARGPRAVALSTTFLPFAAQIDAIAGAIRRQAPKSLLIAGGIQVWKSFQHRTLSERGVIAENIRAAVGEHNYLMDPKRHSPVDLFVVSDAGEETLAEILRCLREGADPRALPNVAWQSEEGWRINPVSPEPYHEVRVDWSRVGLRPAPVYLPVQAGLGCGFRCAFCDFAGLRPVRTRDTQSLIGEIRTMPPHQGVRRVYFTDDNLFPTRQRVKEVCAELIRSGMDLRWRGLIRVDGVDDEAAELMARSGCLEVLLGIESGDAGMLRRMNKRVTPEQILAGVEILSRHGIHTKSTFIVGFPGETPETLANTAALLNAYPTGGEATHRFLFFQFAVLPLSRAASPQFRKEYGIEGYGYRWRHATMTSDEAAAALVQVQENLKVELCPSYVMEVPELDGMSRGALQRACVLRNRIARARRGLPEHPSEPALWDALESCFH